MKANNARQAKKTGMFSLLPDAAADPAIVARQP